MADHSVLPRRRVGTRFVAAVACIIAAAAFVTACGDDSPSESSITRPEDVKAPMPEVLSKLPTMVDLGNEAKAAAASGDFTKAEDEYEELHEIWEAVEGTVKDTDADIYEQIEKVWSKEITPKQYLEGLQKQFAEELAAGNIPPIPAR